MVNISSQLQSLSKQFKGHSIASRKMPLPPFPLPSFIAGLSLSVLIALFAAGFAQAVDECDTNDDCSSGQVCSLDGECMDRIIASGAVLVEMDGPVVAGVPFGLTLVMPFFRNELQLAGNVDHRNTFLDKSAFTRGPRRNRR